MPNKGDEKFRTLANVMQGAGRSYRQILRDIGSGLLKAKKVDRKWQVREQDYYIYVGHMAKKNLTKAWEAAQIFSANAGGEWSAEAFLFAFSSAIYVYQEGETQDYQDTDSWLRSVFALSEMLKSAFQYDKQKREELVWDLMRDMPVGATRIMDAMMEKAQKLRNEKGWGKTK